LLEIDESESDLSPTLKEGLVLRKHHPSWPCHPGREEENFKRIVCFKENVARRLIENEKHKNFEIGKSFFFPI